MTTQTSIKMKRIIAILIFVGLTCFGYADNVPKWIKKLPKAGNNTYRYVMESASGSKIEDARNQAFSRILYTTANRFGMPFSSSDFDGKKDPEALAVQYNIPINKVCEYRKKIPGGVEVYILCQVAEKGNIKAVFEEFRDCEASLSDDIQFEADFPTAWKTYSGNNYISSFQREVNRNRTPETSFKTYLADVAKQEIINRMHLETEEQTFINTLTDYSLQGQEGFAVAYIEKETACNYYEKNIEVLFNKVASGIEQANAFSEADNSTRAEQELQSLLPVLSSIDKQIGKLTKFGCSAKIDTYTSDLSEIEKIVKSKINTIESIEVPVFVECTADLFGEEYFLLEGVINQRLSEKNYILADSPDKAVYKITVKAKTRQHPAAANTSYFAYVDASIIVRKMDTNKVVYSGSVTQKGGSTFNYEDAGRDAYKKIDKQLAEEIASKVKK